ncbi:MAG: 16S rRNA (cytosine(1402)-N(4))-methyltransferase RsmH [Lachnospiraceae bacterium]|nr:16S rRNA (cytosine(1402)-N(4))-methyltransferase RsmH [Lachnospiraceae bacterium]
MDDFRHIPVLLNETIELLNIKEDGIYIDGTIGGGGHSFEIAKLLRPEKGGRLIGLDQDDAAIRAAKNKLTPFSCLLTVERSNFVNMKAVTDSLGIKKVNGILLDLGVSSYQLDSRERGFSYMDDAPLDMRMDRRESLSAYEVVNEYPEKELTRILREYGEERYAGRIACNIIKAREKGSIKSTFELRDIVEASIPMKVKKTGGHPAKRTFQAVRIEVNRELKVLSDSLDMMTDLLSPGGRLAIITFHSLEDRIVKQGFKKNENPCICPPDFPVCVCGRVSKGRVITRKPVVPSKEEMRENPRSKSAKLRVFEAS